jgi:hypothetical protein
MNKIEVTPAKVIKMRVSENRDRNAEMDEISYRYSRHLEVPALPYYASTQELFNERKPWWTKYDGELWIPEILIFSLLVRKEDASEEKYNTKTVYWAERISDITTRYGLWPRSVWPKQQSSFFEQGFARTLVADIDFINKSKNKNLNKNLYNIVSEVEDGFFLTIYQNFLHRLIKTHGNEQNQNLLRNYFDK